MQTIHKLLTEALNRQARITRDYTLYDNEHVYPTNAVKVRLRSVCIPTADLFRKAKGHITLNEYLFLARARKWDLSRDVNYAAASYKYSQKDIIRRLKRLYPNRETIVEIAIPLSWAIGYNTCTIKTAISRLSPYNIIWQSCFLPACKLLLHISKREKRAGYTDALDFEE